jgi:hypothetical protein
MKTSEQRRADMNATRRALEPYNFDRLPRHLAMLIAAGIAWLFRNVFSSYSLVIFALAVAAVFEIIFLVIKKRTGRLQMSLGKAIKPDLSISIAIILVFIVLQVISS